MKIALKKEGWVPGILSRHPSHNCLRGSLPKMSFKSIIRFGSTTERNEVDIFLNSVESIKNSSSKLRMKRCFREGNIKTADWIESLNIAEIQLWAKNKFPIIGKQIFGSRGTGNTMIKNGTQLDQYCLNKNLSNYIFEKYYSYVREYRLHVTVDGCFYTCRKMLKSDTPKDARWYRNNDHCNWILEENILFNKPTNWEQIVEECIKAIKSCGMDFGACDLRVQSAKDEKGNIRTHPDFIVVEVNSAPSLATITEQKYREVLPILLEKKYKEKQLK